MDLKYWCSEEKIIVFIIFMRNNINKPNIIIGTNRVSQLTSYV